MSYSLAALARGMHTSNRGCGRRKVGKVHGGWVGQIRVFSGAGYFGMGDGDGGMKGYRVG